MPRLLVDSGPLVALFDASDRWHQPVAAYLKEYRGELITSAANITEAAWITASASHAMLVEADSLRRDLGRSRGCLCRAIDASSPNDQVPIFR